MLKYPGTYAIQLAKLQGAEITGLYSTANIELIASTGADLVIDYTKQDLPEIDEAFNAIFDAVGKYQKIIVRIITR